MSPEVLRSNLKTEKGIEKPKNFYETFNIPQNASLKRIQKRYNKMRKSIESDEEIDTQEKQDKINELDESLSVLSDKEKRAQYNRDLEIAQSTQETQTDIPVAETSTEIPVSVRQSEDEEKNLTREELVKIGNEALAKLEQERQEGEMFKTRERGLKKEIKESYGGTLEDWKKQEDLTKKKHQKTREVDKEEGERQFGKGILSDEEQIGEQGSIERLEKKEKEEATKDVPYIEVKKKTEKFLNSAKEKAESILNELESNKQISELNIELLKKYLDKKDLEKIEKEGLNQKRIEYLKKQCRSIIEIVQERSDLLEKPGFSNKEGWENLGRKILKKEINEKIAGIEAQESVYEDVVKDEGGIEAGEPELPESSEPPILEKESAKKPKKRQKVELIKNESTGKYELHAPKNFDPRELKRIKEAINATREKQKARIELDQKPEDFIKEDLKDIPEDLVKQVEALLSEEAEKLRSGQESAESKEVEKRKTKEPKEESLTKEQSKGIVGSEQGEKIDEASKSKEYWSSGFFGKLKIELRDFWKGLTRKNLKREIKDTLGLEEGQTMGSSFKEAGSEFAKVFTKDFWSSSWRNAKAYVRENASWNPLDWFKSDRIERPKKK